MAKKPLKASVKKTLYFAGSDLLKAREAAGLAQWQLAERIEQACIEAGEEKGFWSQPRISMLESLIIPHHITEDHLRILNKILSNTRSTVKAAVTTNCSR